MWTVENTAVLTAAVRSAVCSKPVLSCIFRPSWSLPQVLKLISVSHTCPTVPLTPGTYIQLSETVICLRHGRRNLGSPFMRVEKMPAIVPFSRSTGELWKIHVFLLQLADVQSSPTSASFFLYRQEQF